ncbi:MAG: recombinase family protein [Actinomycetota bacterium]|nr:recombinase family protein [Actinomycetota bacterium]
MPKRAAIYVRISSDPNGLRAGVGRQEEDCRALAQQRGWDVVKVYSDNDVSAYSGKPRPAYRDLLEDIKNHVVDALVVWHLDRLHRAPKELETFFEVCDGAGLKAMACVSGDIDLSTDDGRFHARILGAVSRKESDDKSRRTSRKKLELAKAGRNGGGGTRPYGYMEDRVTINKPEARLIRQAARRVLAGESLHGICRDWTARGIPTVTGAFWSTTVLRRNLTSPRVAGLREHHGVIVADAQWKPIIDRGTHERLCNLLLDPRRTKKGSNARTYPLTGLVFCGLCDKRLVARPRADHARCYVCASGVNFHGCGKIRQLSEPFEDHVRDAVFVALDSPDLSRTIAAVTGDDLEQQELFDSLRADEEALEQLARDHYADRIISRAEYLAARAAIERSTELTKSRLSGRGAVSVLSELPAGKALEKAWAEGNLEWRRAVIGAVIEKVVLHPAVKGRNFFDPERVEIVWRDEKPHT